jgi:hypothetical protein
MATRVWDSPGVFAQGESGPSLKLTTVTNPWSRVLPEKLTVPRLVKKFPAFYESQTFITVFVTASHLSLS